MKSRVWSVILQCVVKYKIDIVLFVSLIPQGLIYLEILNATVLVLLNLLVDQRPAHGLLDDFVIIGYLSSTDKMEEQVLAIHPVKLALDAQ